MALAYRVKMLPRRVADLVELLRVRVAYPMKLRVIAFARGVKMLPRRIAKLARRMVTRPLRPMPTLRGRVSRRLEHLDVQPPLWLASPRWWRTLMFLLNRGRFPPLQRRMDLIVGIGPENVPIVRNWLAGNQGRSAVLVMSHEALKDTDFGCDVFTQNELVPSGSEEDAAITADWKRKFQSLCDRLKHVRLDDMEVARCALEEALQAVYRTAVIARAARVLFTRGYWHVAIVMNAFKFVDGSLVEEARACGLASAHATALVVREGSLSSYNTLTMPIDWSTPEEWVAEYLHRLDPADEVSSDFVALGFGEPSRAAQLEAVTGELLQPDGDEPLPDVSDALAGAQKGRSISFDVVRELTVADPRGVADTLATLLAKWQRDLAARATKGRGSWKQLGQFSFKAVEARLLVIRDCIPLMLRGLARLERLNAIRRQPGRPKVVVYDPTAWPSAPDAIPGLRDSLRFSPFPLHWDAADVQANQRLASVWKQILREERDARAVEGAKLHVLAGVGLEQIPHVSTWLRELKGRRAVLLMRHDELSSCDFGCDRFHDLDLIPTNSDLEEEIYRSCAEHREHRQTVLDAEDFLGIPLTLDFFRAVAAPGERLMMIMRAVRLLYERGYEHVVVVFGAGNDYLGSLVLEARACGVMPANGAARRVVGSEVQADHDLSTPSMLKSARQYAEGVARRLPASHGKAKVLIAALSSAPQFLRNGRVVIDALAERDQELLLVTPLQEGFGWTDDTGLKVATLDGGASIAARDPVALNKAADAFLDSLGRLAQTAIAGHTSLSWRNLGEATSDFHDLHASGRDVIANALRRHLTQIDMLDEIVATAGPRVIYKFPSSATIMDGSLLGVAGKYAIRQVASVFLSLSASFRDLDRAPQDIITVLGDAQAETLKSNLVANQVIPLGQPEMDTLTRNWSPARSRDHVRRMTPAWDGKKRIVLVATSNFDARNEPTWVRELCRHAAKRGDVHVLVKLHPSTPIEVYREKLACNGSEVSLVADPEIAPYMEIASVVVTDVSHSGKIAVYLNKPLMVVNTSGTPFPYHRYDEEGVALGALSLAEIAPVLDRILAGQAAAPRRAEFVRREFTSDDNHASDRIADLVVSLTRTDARQAKIAAP